MKNEEVCRALKARLEEALVDCAANRHEREVVCANYEVILAERDALKAELCQMTTFRDNAANHSGRIRAECSAVEKERDALKAACAGNFKQAQENAIERDKVNAHRAEVMAEREALKDELESVREVLEATRVARDAAQYLLSEKTTDRDNERLNSLALQSELTKARDLLDEENAENCVLREALKDVLNWIEVSASRTVLEKICRDALAHQSAPAAKGESDA